MLPPDLERLLVANVPTEIEENHLVVFRICRLVKGYINAQKDFIPDAREIMEVIYPLLPPQMVCGENKTLTDFVGFFNALYPKARTGIDPKFKERVCHESKERFIKGPLSPEAQKYSDNPSAQMLLCLFEDLQWYRLMENEVINAYDCPDLFLVQIPDLPFPAYECDTHPFESLKPWVPFWFSCRDAAQFVGAKSRFTVRRYIEAFIADGILTIEKIGDKPTRGKKPKDANRYLLWPVIHAFQINTQNLRNLASGNIAAFYKDHLNGVGR